MFSSTKWQIAEEKWRRMNWRNRKKEGKKWEETESKKSGKVEEKQGEKGEKCEAGIHKYPISISHQHCQQHHTINRTAAKY